MFMGKVVQTIIDEVEYQLLKEMSRKTGKTIKALLREAISQFLERTEIREDDSLFLPPSSKKGDKEGSIKHDEYLYGA